MNELSAITSSYDTTHYNKVVQRGCSRDNQRSSRRFSTDHHRYRGLTFTLMYSRLRNVWTSSRKDEQTLVYHVGCQGKIHCLHAEGANFAARWVGVGEC